jgi:CrcB protein
MRMILLVGLGGAAGSMLRYWLGGLVQDRMGTAAFPTGTLAVNVVGCLAIGVLAYLIDSRGAAGPELRALLMIGVLGGFTTFSAFGNETLNLIRDGEAALAGTNVVASVALGLGAVWLGRVVAHAVWR